jgi:hypothetical protein
MEESRRSERWMKSKGVQARGGAHQRMAVGGGNSSNDAISSEGATRMRERAKGERGDERGLKKGITSGKMEGGSGAVSSSMVHAVSGNRDSAAAWAGGVERRCKGVESVSE